MKKQTNWYEEWTTQDQYEENAFKSNSFKQFRQLFMLYFCINQDKPWET